MDPMKRAYIQTLKQWNETAVCYCCGKQAIYLPGKPPAWKRRCFECMPVPAKRYLCKVEGCHKCGLHCPHEGQPRQKQVPHLREVSEEQKIICLDTRRAEK